MGTAEDCIVYQNEAGRILRDNCDLFLTKRVIQSFGNYATAQLRRLLNALCHDQYTGQEREHHLLAVLNRQIEHFQRTYTSFDVNAIQLFVSTESELRFNIHLEDYPVRDFAGIYNEMNQMIKTYHKLNHRNRKKDEPHLYKHAMHLIRLLLTGIDILNGKGILTKRIAEHKLLMDIRNAGYSFDEIKDMTCEYQKKFEQAAQKTELPEEADIKRIEELMRQIYCSLELTVL